MKCLNLLIIMFLLFVSLRAQENGLFVSREINNAIKRGTRTENGMPGPNYWQNTADYKIEAEFDPQTGKIKGKQLITYTNNSPNAMYAIFLNLYPNLFKKGNARDKEVDPRDIHDGIKIIRINVDGTEIDMRTRKPMMEGTKMNLLLPKSLYSKNKAQIEMEWEFTMQWYTQIRVGKYGVNTWFIGYWYPQIAVYDDLFGWDYLDYDGLHEFYSGFANFDVKLTVPGKQIVWATGVWQNPEQILEETYLKRYNDAQNSEKVMNIVNVDDLQKKILKNESRNTYHFMAQNVTDFSFATSDSYLWDGVSVIVDKKQKQSTFIQTAYNKQSADFYEVAEISKKTIDYLSNVMPAIPFPYPRMTVFNGDGGMEFPMMVNDRSTGSKSETVNLTSHEIAHTYFPFYMGINQERFSWMDEGWAQFLPAEFQDAQVPNNKQVELSAFNYAYYAGTSLEMPMMVPSHFLKGYEYYITSYYRPEIAFRVLENTLGKELFLKCLREYIHRWKGKYSNPYDLFFTFNDVSKQDLTWFWKPWFFEIAAPDLGIQSYRKEKDGYLIDIDNIGGLPLPIELNIEFSDGTKNRILKTADVWKGNKNVHQVQLKTEKQIRTIRLGANWIPDSNYSNNQK